MKKYKVVFLASFVVMSVTVYATTKEQFSVISAMKQGKKVECTGVKKVITAKKVRVHEGYKVELSLNESGNSFEATEQDTSDLGGYSPIPYPCDLIDGFTSTDLNISNEKVFVCRDDSYAITEEVYLLKNCMLKVY
ncbi:MAG: Unknown protein [uncultured Sulfurovum sp.]|uniref:Uncharacterized protein n=1 Tax=uncultured Sulfurovum sp. TaxID=269237 RepID=A0A6S6SFK4_9BACT|nr:MAG: Unknown protein [uncultured Sulfurovum sp.]